jgi:hypothetical protein
MFGSVSAVVVCSSSVFVRVDTGSGPLRLLVPTDVFLGAGFGALLDGLPAAGSVDSSNLAGLLGLHFARPVEPGSALSSEGDFRVRPVALPALPIVPVCYDEDEDLPF